MNKNRNRLSVSDKIKSNLTTVPPIEYYQYSLGEPSGDIVSHMFYKVPKTYRWDGQLKKK